MAAKKKRRQYDDQFRASAVVMLESQGYPDRKGALTHVANHLGIPARTLSRWFNKEQNPPPDQLVREKRGELVDLIDDEIARAFDAMNAVREDASYRDLVIGAATLIDKKQLLTGGATERTEARIDHDISDDTRTAILSQLSRIAGTGDPPAGD